MMIADLKTPCKTCGGSGQKPGLMSGGIPQINIGGRCQDCEGRGFLLTELGQDLWRLFQPFVEQLIDQKLGALPKPK